MEYKRIKFDEETKYFLTLNNDVNPVTIKLESGQMLLEICKRQSFIIYGRSRYAFYNETYSIDLNTLIFRYDKLDDIHDNM